MMKHVRQTGIGYLVSLLVTAGMVLFRWLLTPLMGNDLPLATLFGAVAFAVWFAGYRAALLAATVGYIACDILFIEPRNIIGLQHARNFVGAVLYLFSCAIIIGFGEALRTARRRADVQREALRVTLASLGDAVITTDAAGCLTSLNPVAATLTGWTQQDAVGRPLDEVFRIVNEDTRQPVDNPVSKVLSLGRVIGLANHTILLSRNGGSVPIDDSAAPIRGRDGRITGVVLVFRDVGERRRAEQELRRTNEQLQIVTESMATSVTRCSRDCCYLWVSRPYADWIGRPVAEIVGRPIVDIIGAEAFQQLRVHFEQVLAGQKVQHEESIDFRGLGRRWINAVYTPTLDAAGVPDGWVGVVNDITEQRSMLEALRDSEQRFARFMQHLPGLAWIKDLQGRYVYANDAALKAFGCTREGLYGKSDTEVFPSATAMQFQENDRKALARDTGVNTIETLEHADGIVHYSVVSKFPILGSDGKSLLVSGMAIDITNLKQAEQAVRSLLRISERLNSTLDVDKLLDILVQEAIHLVNAESGVSGLFAAEGMTCRKYFRKGEELTLDYCWPPMHGLPGWLIVHRVPYLTNDALADTQIVRELCIQFGVHSALSTPILSAQGEVLGFFEIHNKEGGFTPADQEMLLAVSHAAAIAIQNALSYRRIQQTEESLREADRRKNDFLATLAHELRNPLAPIRTNLELLRLATGKPAVMDQARSMIERQVAQMVRLIDDLLDISRITRGRLQLRRERVDVAAIVRSAVETSKPVIEAAGHDLVVSLPANPIHLDADPTRLSQVVANLLTNAAKYTAAGGRIWLTVERHEDEVVVSLRDTGIGIAAQHLAYIFEMFSQVQSALDRSQGGLGVGLALVRGFVELHGGSVRARSDGPGQGSEFIVRLPLSAASLAETPAVLEVDGGRQSTAKQRILIVDDLKDGTDSLAMLLKMTGHEVHTAYDGEQAIAAAAECKPDVILLDIGMPKMNGYEACRHIRAQHWGREILIIALTGWGQEDDRLRTREAGFDRHLVKPVEPAMLDRLLSELRGQ